MRVHREVHQGRWFSSKRWKYESPFFYEFWPVWSNAFYSNINPYIKYDVLCDKNDILKIFFKEKEIFQKRYLIKLR